MSEVVDDMNWCIRYQMLEATSNQDSFNFRVDWYRKESSATLDQVASLIEDQHKAIDAMRQMEIQRYGRPLTEYHPPEALSNGTSSGNTSDPMPRDVTKQEGE